MASCERWYFDLEQIHSTPSIKCGYDHDKELSCRQQAANFIQDMGQRLQVNQLCINTAIVYMHRFYMFHSFQRFHRTSLASASLFLAAKVEEQPRKLEHVIRFAQICLHRDQMPFDVTSQAYMEQVQDLIMNENILLQTLGFDVAIDHPHTHIVRCCQLVRASKDLAQTSYFMASYSLHLTTMCLQYKPTVVACFCIHLACKWSNWEIPESSEGRQWFWYVDKSVTSELLESLTAEFLNLFEKCPSRLKKKIMALSSYSNMPSSISNAPQGPPTQIPMSQAEIDKKKESRIAVESHNPMNSMPLPIGPLGVAVAEANSLQGVQTHPFIHQNTIVARHNSCSENLMKKHHYEHTGPTQRTQIAGPPPPPLPLDQPYKKLHHPPHHQRENHSMGIQGGAKLPSCMFDVGVVPAPPHKAYPQHGSAHVNPPAVHPAASRTTNHVPTAHRPPSRPHVRNGEAHYPDKKLPLEVKPVETKLPQVVAPSIPVAARVKPKTPPNQLSLEPVVPPIKMERSIFSPEEKACSPPPPPPPSRVHEKPKICSPVVIKKESPHTDPPTLPQASGALPSQDARPTTHPPLNTGDAASRERVTPGVPLPAPDTPSKSSHAKKKKKKHKEHKDKHKDKHKHKHRVKDPEPIVITIPKEKITISHPHPEGLKIKIAKEKISAPPAATTGLKLKISKDKLKKRERGSGGEEDDVQQPSKQHRPNGTAVLQVGLETGARH